ncbi:hypothetical protein [Clostridium sp.]|uniref:hypothetical protein n=1 Tax=Clostridium sp. TaxID=1506 RepID=UPI003EEE7D78
MLSKEGYEDAIGNRFYNTSMVICTTDNYTAQVTDLTFGENVYKDYKDNNKVRYLYEVKLDFISSDGKTKTPEIAKGAVELVKEDGTWKVSLFDINQFLK